MKRYLVSLLTFFLLGCKEENRNLELEIISKELISKKHQTKNILRYKLTNKSKTTFYFNHLPQSFILSKINNFIMLNNSCLIVKNSKNDTLKAGYGSMDFTLEYSAFKEDQLTPIRELGYTKNEEFISNSKNFVIHPNETLFFEDLVYLPEDKKFNNYKFHSIKKNSFASIFMFSDTTKLKKAISIPTMQNIKENNYTVFHGVIISKNKIPIKIIK